MIHQIDRKIHDDRRLDATEAEFLFSDAVDLHQVGRWADVARRRRCGEIVHYNVNRHLNPTNVCLYRCPLCAYSRDEDDPDAYVLDAETILARAREAVDDGARELHIVGGLHPRLPYEWYLDILRSLHEALPQLLLKAWTAVEVAHFVRLSGRSIRRVLEDLVDAGLCSLPGGGAEIFASSVRQRICPTKPDAETWLDVHRAAHDLGLSTNATMLFGHVETAADRVDHLMRLRSLQDETSGFQAFVPLSFHPSGTRLAHLPGPSALDDLRTVAVSRLVLDNFPHIKAYWISLGVGTAQTALSYGADDLDGTVATEQIHHAAGSTAPESLTVEQLRALIEEVGRVPCQRDTLYRPVGLER